MGWCFPHKGLVLAALLPLCIVGYFAYQQVGTGFMPEMDEGGFNIDYRSVPGTSLAETDRLLQQFETILRQTPEVATYSRRTGLQLGGWLTEANQGDFFVQLKPPPRRDIEEVMADVRARVTKQVPGLGSRVRADHGGPHRRPDQRAAAHRNPALRRGSGDVGTHRQRRGGDRGQDRRSGGREERPRHRG